MAASEAQVGTTLGQVDATDGLALRIEDGNSVEPLFAHAPTDPQVAVDIDTQTVRRTISLGSNERAAVREFGAVVGDVKDADSARCDSGFDDVELRFIGREREAIRSINVTGHDGELLRVWVAAIDVGGQLRLRDMTFVKAEDAEGRIREPD